MSDPQTTIPPIGNLDVLPECAVRCGPLYDANGGCVPPAFNQDAAAQTACFCGNAAVAPFSTAVNAVCNGVCPQETDLSSIANWFRDICSVGGGNDDGNGNGGNDGDSSSSSTTTTNGSGSSSGSNSGADAGGGGDWLSNHWQWVIMLVVLVVGITGIWIGACIWRRRYLRRKDRQSTLSQKQSGSVSHPSWGPDAAAAATGGSVRGSTGPGVFMSGSAANNTFEFEEKPAHQSRMKKWLVSERT